MKQRILVAVVGVPALIGVLCWLWWLVCGWRGFPDLVR